MKYLTLLAQTIGFLNSCAQINQESRDRYQAEHKIKHGIIIREKTKTLSQKLDEASVMSGKVPCRAGKSPLVSQRERISCLISSHFDFCENSPA
jgi:hypothetical protein